MTVAPGGVTTPAPAATIRLPVTTTDAFVTTVPVFTSSMRAARTTVVFGTACAGDQAGAAPINARTAASPRATVVMRQSPESDQFRSKLADQRAPFVDQRPILRIVVPRWEEPWRVVGQRRSGNVACK